MKKIVALSALVLVTSACGKKSSNSGVKSLASSANQTLVDEIVRIETENAKAENFCNKLPEMSLNYVLEQRAKYGIGDEEARLIREDLGDREIDKLVIKLVDFNEMYGKAPARWVKIAENEESIDSLEAFDDNGRLDVIDGKDEEKAKTYLFPIFTIGYSEQSQGASCTSQLRLADAPGSDGGMMINAIQFNDVKEPWIKGAAEVYASITYIGKDGKGASELVEFPSVDKKGRRYDLRQVVHMWNANKYQITNVAFFEHDSRYDYSNIAKIFVTAAASVVSAVVNPTQTTTLAVAGIVSEVAGKVIDALPKGALSDDDDFLDVINTIEKYAPGNRGEVSGNVQAEMSFYEVKLNDE